MTVVELVGIGYGTSELPLELVLVEELAVLVL